MQVKKYVNNWVIVLITLGLSFGGIALIALDVSKRNNMVRDLGCSWFKEGFTQFLGGVIMLGMALAVAAIIPKSNEIRGYMIGIGITVIGITGPVGLFLGSPRLLPIIIFLPIGILILHLMKSKTPQQRQQQSEANEYLMPVEVRSIEPVGSLDAVVFQFRIRQTFPYDYLYFETMAPYNVGDQKMIDVRKLDRNLVKETQFGEAVDGSNLQDEDFTEMNILLKKILDRAQTTSC